MSSAPLAVVAAALALAATAQAEMPARCLRTSECDARQVGRGLSLERRDASRVRVARRARLLCSPWSESTPKPALHLVVGRPRARRAYWSLEVVRRSVARPSTFAFPLDEVEPHVRGVLMFASDPTRRNELSSTEEEASGGLTVTRARCSPRPELAFSVRARLGSELFGLPVLRARGEVRFVGRAGA